MTHFKKEIVQNIVPSKILVQVRTKKFGSDY